MTNYSKDIAILRTDDEAGPAVSYQAATVSVPVTLTPFAAAGPIVTYGLTEPVITPGITSLQGFIATSTSFTVTQNICIAVPIEFGANVTAGDPSVISKAASADTYKIRGKNVS
jgi:hypothetical protein